MTSTEWLNQRKDLIECEYGGRTVATLEACLKRTVRSNHACVCCNSREKLINGKGEPTARDIERIADRIARQGRR